MKRYKWILIVLNLLILLVYFNFSVSEKERILKDGRLILLELAPVDPRSLMQGDYMSLSYAIADLESDKKIPKRGFCVIKLDSNQVAKRVRFQKEKTPLSQSEHLIEYTAPNEWSINIGAESYFFQEGEAEKFEKAKYGGIRIDKNGNSLLVGLYNEKLKLIK